METNERGRVTGFNGDGQADLAVIDAGGGVDPGSVRRTWRSAAPLAFE